MDDCKRMVIVLGGPLTAESPRSRERGIRQALVAAAKDGKR